jgi:hypothetical protein
MIIFSPGDTIFCSGLLRAVANTTSSTVLPGLIATATFLGSGRGARFRFLFGGRGGGGAIDTTERAEEEAEEAEEEEKEEEDEEEEEEFSAVLCFAASVVAALRAHIE